MGFTNLCIGKLLLKMVPLFGKKRLKLFSLKNSLRYIYEPIFRFNNNFAIRIGSSIVCFSFVYVWHGTHTSVLIWSVLNNLGIIAETFGKEISKTKMYSKLEVSYLRFI